MPTICVLRAIKEEALYRRTTSRRQQIIQWARLLKQLHMFAWLLAGHDPSGIGALPKIGIQPAAQFRNEL